MAEKRTKSRPKRHSIPAEIVDAVLNSPIGESLNQKIRQIMSLPQQQRQESSGSIRSEARNVADKIKADRLKNDPYKVLGVDRSMTMDDISTVYKALMKKYHPDGTHPDKVKAQELNKAFEQIQKERKKR
jgi:DnaJ-domain-containing protein 1